MSPSLSPFTVVSVYLSEFDSAVHHVEATDSQDAISKAYVLLGKQLEKCPEDYDDLQDFEDEVSDDVVIAAVFEGKIESAY